MADEENETQAGEEKSGGGLKQKLIISGIGVALLMGGVFAGPAIKNMISPPPSEEGEAAQEKLADIDEPAIYHSLHPPLVVNFKDSSGDGHFMQITLEVMSRKQDVINAVQDHTPAIRNALILLFGTTDYDAVITREGKEQMLERALAEIQNVLRDRFGDPGVESVYFTNLIIQ